MSKRITKKEAEELLKRKDTKPSVMFMLVALALTGLFWLSIVAGYKALILYIFGG